MFLTFKRKSIVAVLLFMVVTIITCFVISAVSTSAYNVPKIGKTVVIDAGHGGRDGGVTGVKSGISEADINLIISKNLRHFLLSYGYDVVLTRTGVDGLYGMTSKNKKMDDMKKRRDIINSARPDLLVSIHQNFFPIQEVRGAQVFYAPSSSEGEKIADIMQNTLNSSLANTNRESAKGDYYILQCTEYPSILIECGFLSNYEDESLLITPSYQEKVAYAIFSGINAIILAQEN